MQNLIKIDLHTHSTTSYDGGISRKQYHNFLGSNPNFVVAVTDHNNIEFASSLFKEFPKQVIVGEEILTLSGEVIGLFLTQEIAPRQSLQNTIQQIKAQNGLVYIPHPFEVTRKGINHQELLQIIQQIDIIEVYNARSKEPWLHKDLVDFAKLHQLISASSSDAHGVRGLNSSYTQISDWPTVQNLKQLLQNGQIHKSPQPWLAYLDPLKNKLTKLFYA